MEIHLVVRRQHSSLRELIARARRSEREKNDHHDQRSVQINILHQGELPGFPRHFGILTPIFNFGTLVRRVEKDKDRVLYGVQRTPAPLFDPFETLGSYELRRIPAPLSDQRGTVVKAAREGDALHRGRVITFRRHSKSDGRPLCASLGNRSTARDMTARAFVGAQAFA
ncbi:MAG: hypothetical protein KY459_05915 [Acidobacteria bacterium]|nr:hypothetical protein [Acidobacteriota bacterium]